MTKRRGDALVTVDTGRIRNDATVNRELACLSHLFSKAVEWGMLEESLSGGCGNLFQGEQPKDSFSVRGRNQGPPGGGV